MNKPTKLKLLYRFLTKLTFELVTIIAGILIALFVNNLQENKRDSEVLASTLHSLSLEFDKNTENINRIQPILERFRDTLEYYDKNPALSIYDLTTKAKGLTTAELYTTNWQSTLSSNSLRLLNFETVTKLSQIDAKHKELLDQTASLTSILYSPSLYRTGKEGIEYRKVLSVWLGGYLGNERELIVLYQEFNTLIKKGTQN
ncbi:MAG: hypothetical protein C0490_23175 [Marivirga sp.]|nr:hypothetical protein [Marivirga sp.]